MVRSLASSTTPGSCTPTVLMVASWTWWVMEANCSAWVDHTSLAVVVTAAAGNQVACCKVQHCTIVDAVSAFDSCEANTTSGSTAASVVITTLALAFKLAMCLDKAAPSSFVTKSVWWCARAKSCDTTTQRLALCRGCRTLLISTRSAARTCCLASLIAPGNG